MAKADLSKEVLKRVRRPLALTRFGMVAERAARAFWPVWSVSILVLAVLMLGLHDMVGVEIVWAGMVLAVLGALVSLIYGVRRFAWPSRAAALERLDATMRGRPIRAVLDTQAVGAGDLGSEAVWATHRQRMAARAGQAKAVQPDLQVSRFDRFGLRYVALLILMIGVLFGSVLRVGSVTEMTPGAAQAAAGPSWEGWIEPPYYTGLPSRYLNDFEAGELDIPQGSLVTLRFYGQVGSLTLAETVSGRVGEVPSASDPAQSFEVSQSGEINIDGPGGRTWSVAVTGDMPPVIAPSGEVETSARGEMTLPFSASDDYGVVSGFAALELDLASVDRRHGLAADPEPRETLLVDLPMPVTGDRTEFDETLIDDFSDHPWAHLPVKIKLQAEDEPRQFGSSEVSIDRLPARRFFDPLAAALIEQRRDLLWTRENADRVALLLRTIMHRPEEGIFPKETYYLRLKFIMNRLETYRDYGLPAEVRDELAQALWELALQIEEGDLADALERLRRAQDRLREAMRNGATDDEIAQLMQELRQATEDYMRQLSRQAENQDGEQQPGEQQQGENLEMTQDDLQAMMDRIQELMEQGRMAEAQQALEELQRLLENMQVTQGQQGQGQQSPGQQAMEGLAETLRDQQGLSDEAFRDLQEQFNPDAQTGESDENVGRNGNQGQGQSHEGQNGEGQGQGDQQGESGQPTEGDLADRQQALRQELNRQQQNLPGAGTPEGDAARDALGRAGDAMEGAEDALRNGDLPEAIDRQAEAMDALREGMRNLGEAMAQQQRENNGNQGTAEGNPEGQERDPLGRNAGSNGQIGTEDELLQGEDVYRRAQDLLDEIRRRSGDADRSEQERDYLKRLLDRF